VLAQGALSFSEKIPPEKRMPEMGELKSLRKAPPGRSRGHLGWHDFVPSGPFYSAAEASSAQFSADIGRQLA
jgi:hypothetical protein